VYDQGQLGSCTANAIAGAIQFDEIRSGIAPTWTPSRLFIYYHERVVEGTVDTDSGAQLRDGVKVIATNGVQYARPGGRQVLDVFTCIREHTHLDAAGKLLTQNAERHLKSDAEMRALFRDRPEAIENTARLADRLEFSLENIGYEFPSFPVPDGHDMNSFLRTITLFGAQQRYAAGVADIIELADFATEVAILSLWIAKHQMNTEFKEKFNLSIPLIPLRETGQIWQGNATRQGRASAARRSSRPRKTDSSSSIST